MMSSQRLVLFQSAWKLVLSNIQTCPSLLAWLFIEFICWFIYLLLLLLFSTASHQYVSNVQFFLIRNVIDSPRSNKHNKNCYCIMRQKSTSLCKWEHTAQLCYSLCRSDLAWHCLCVYASGHLVSVLHWRLHSLMAVWSMLQIPGEKTACQIYGFWTYKYNIKSILSIIW